MNGNTATIEANRAIFVRLFLHRIRHIAIFNDQRRTILHAKMANLLQRIGLRHHLTRQLGLTEHVKTNKGRIDALNDWVINLEVTDTINAHLRHLRHRATTHQRTKRTAVSVWRHRDLRFLSEQNFAFIVDRRH